MTYKNYYWTCSCLLIFVQTAQQKLLLVMHFTLQLTAVVGRAGRIVI